MWPVVPPFVQRQCKQLTEVTHRFLLGAHQCPSTTSEDLFSLYTFLRLKGNWNKNWLHLASCVEFSLRVTIAVSDHLLSGVTTATVIKKKTQSWGITRPALAVLNIPSLIFTLGCVVWEVLSPLLLKNLVFYIHLTGRKQEMFAIQTSFHIKERYFFLLLSTFTV